MGDTFRWKSENVSSAEVEAVLSSSSDLRDVIVFGVKVPGYDGTGGMAVIADVDRNVDMSKLEKEINDTLPAYARPLFIRITKEIPMTGLYP
jgi:solute carrier family 27 fatty acid transporter 1/4